MGVLLYGSTAFEIAFDDRTLTHLQVVITAKLRRRESFLFTWTNSLNVGGGHTSIWLDPSCSLIYRFLGGRIPSLNRAWITELMDSANSGRGLVLTVEPASATTGTITIPTTTVRGDAASHP